MLNFLNDYSAGAHQKILDALIKTNFIETAGYGEDEFCNEAKEIIKKKFSCPNSDIFFFVGGTQVNLTVISHILRPYEAVIACTTGHIAVHEAGAIEATGHKVITVKGENYKITPEEIEFQCLIHTDYGMVKPKMVYISNSTEMGTVYTKKELEKIKKMCEKYDLYLFIDGARLASGLTSNKTDLKEEDFSKYCDIFYIGGTKSGLLFGEALVINDDKLKENFKYTMKQKGCILAKGKLIGIQFIELFKDNIYREIGEHSNRLAQKITDAFVKKGFKLLVDGGTNQIFLKMSKEEVKKLEKYIKFSTFPPENIEDKFEIVRFVTSWNTKENEIDEFLKIIEELF